jgi:hypothetical protein
VGHESASGHFEWRPVKDLSGEATTHGTGDWQGMRVPPKMVWALLIN